MTVKHKNYNNNFKVAKNTRLSQSVFLNSIIYRKINFYMIQEEIESLLEDY
jgi:hypothetical protein